MTGYTDFRLKAPDEQAAKAAARDVLKLDPTFTLLREDGSWLLQTARHSVDPIGTVWDPGEYDPDTGEISVQPSLREGWFANLRVIDAIAGPVAHALSIAGAPHGVVLVEDTGRVWA